MDVFSDGSVIREVYWILWWDFVILGFFGVVFSMCGPFRNA